MKPLIQTGARIVEGLLVVTPAYWDDNQAVNLRHHFFATQAVAPAMKAAGGGSVLCLGSVSWMRATPGMVSYTTAKAALQGLVRTLARELGPDNIRVNCIVPGAVSTARQQALWLTPERESQLVDSQALKLRLQPDDMRSDAPYRTLAELIDHAKKEPGRVRIGHPGAGSVGDFCIQQINALTGAQLLAVPYTGAAPTVTALRGEHIEGVVLALGALSAHVKSGAFRALVISGRVPELPELRTMRELGYPDDLFGIWFSFLAPAGIPEDARKALVAAIEQAVKAPAIAARLASMGILQSHATPEQQTAEMRDELKRVSDLAKRTGLVK